MLITLGILGIVIAMTLPNVISGYRKKVTVENLKVAYSIINNAIKASEVKNGDYHYWMYNIDNKDFFDIYFKPYLNILQDCGREKKGCFKKCNETLDGWLSVNGQYQFDGGWTPNYYYKVILSNGMSLAVANQFDSIRCSNIVVDLDGPKKGKSIMGEDVFLFKLCGEIVNGWGEVGLHPGSECAIGRASTHNNSSLDKLLTDTSCRGGCNLNAVSANGRLPGEACSAVIIKNNYTIPENYPIKF